MNERAVRVADATRLPAVVLLPGLDGTGKLFAELVKSLDPGVSAIVVAYPRDQPMGYEELDTLVMSVLNKLPPDQRYVLLGESFSGPLAIRIAARARQVSWVSSSAHPSRRTRSHGWAGRGRLPPTCP